MVPCKAHILLEIVEMGVKMAAVVLFFLLVLCFYFTFTASNIKISSRTGYDDLTPFDKGKFVETETVRRGLRVGGGGRGGGFGGRGRGGGFGLGLGRGRGRGRGGKSDEPSSGHGSSHHHKSNCVSNDPLAAAFTCIAAAMMAVLFLV